MTPVVGWEPVSVARLVKVATHRSHRVPRRISEATRFYSQTSHRAVQPGDVGVTIRLLDAVLLQSSNMENIWASQ